MALEEKPVGRARRWRDEGASRDEVAARLQAEGLDTGSIAVVLDNTFGPPASSMAKAPASRRARGGGAVFSALSAGAAVFALGLGGRAFFGGADASYSPALVAHGCSVFLLVCAFALEPGRVSAPAFTGFGLGALLALLPAYRTYSAEMYDATHVHTKAGETGGAILGAIGGGFVWVMAMWFIGESVLAVMAALGFGRRAAS
jgi:hypothetical protein